MKIEVAPIIAKRKPLYKELQEGLAAQAEHAKRAYDELEAEQAKLLDRQQVLVDMIMQAEELINFKQAHDWRAAGVAGVHPSSSHCQAGTKEQQHDRLPQAGTARWLCPGAGVCSCQRYVSSLLCGRMQQQLVQAVAGWLADDWNGFLNSTMQQLAVLLEVTERTGGRAAGAIPAGTVSHTVIAEQQLKQVVDQFVATTVIAVAYSGITGPHLSGCTSINQMSKLPEVPPQHHWQQVAERLQLTGSQQQQLSAAYREFVHMQKMQQKMQLAFAQALACPNSCSLQLVAAAKQTVTAANKSTHVWDFGSATAAAAAKQVDQGSSSQASAADRGLVSPTGFVTAASGCATPAAGHFACGEDPFELLDRLLAMWNSSPLLLLLFLFNTLTHHQIARMIVASYPFMPRPAPLVEAVAQLPPSAASTSQAASQATSNQPAEKASLRTGTLQTQLGRWWEEFDASSHNSVGS